MKQRLTFACWEYDRTRALADGTVRADGIELNYLTLPVEETFFRMIRGREFDASEMSLSSYSASLHSPNPPFVAIPVFPSRFFRHSCIFEHEERHPPAGRAERQARRRARVPDDRAGLDPRHPVRRVRRQGHRV